MTGKADENKAETSMSIITITSLTHFGHVCKLKTFTVHFQVLSNQPGVSTTMFYKMYLYVLPFQFKKLLSYTSRFLKNVPQLAAAAMLRMPALTSSLITITQKCTR